MPQPARPEETLPPPEDLPARPRPGALTMIGRAFRLRCPRCGRGKMFRGLFRMLPVCDSCGFRFERDSGFFLGSIYINYGWTAMITTIGYISLRFGLDIPGKTLVFVFMPFCVLFPLFFFRYARALWLALDCRLDRSTLEDRQTR